MVKEASLLQARRPVLLPSHAHLRLSGCAASLCVPRAGLLAAGWRSLSTSVLRVVEAMIDEAEKMETNGITVQEFTSRGGRRA